MSCCDYVVATADVRIALSEGKLGILPAVIGPYVYRRLGSAAFRRLAMQASRINSEEALRIGFIEAVVDAKDNLETIVTDIVAEVMTTGPSAVALAKELTLDFTSRMRGSNEGQEGLSSFLEKRPANWKPDDD